MADRDKDGDSKHVLRSECFDIVTIILLQRLRI